MTEGTTIAHTEGGSDFTISQTGVYAVSFHATLAPATGATFPLSVLLQLEQNGAAVTGAVVQHTFQEAADSASVSFSTPVSVIEAPATLAVTATGGNFLYSAVSLSIYKVL